VKITGVFFLLLILCFSSCGTREQEVFVQKNGFYYRLISFSDEGHRPSSAKYIHLRASFKTQRDSVFWDSFNNLNDLFILEADSLADGILTSQVSRHVPGDSFCIAIPVPAFMNEVYHTSEVPLFLKKDSLVRVYLKLANMFDNAHLLPGQKELELQEYQQIEAYLGGAEASEKARDASGFFWIEKPENSSDLITGGQTVILSLQGSFLSGRPLDKVPLRQEFVYGNPDQVLPGINNAIARLGEGQTAKIILPSHLAFGEFGSSNGAVPPFTPLIYRIRIGTKKL
jgi:hypothetical protein